MSGKTPQPGVSLDYERFDGWLTFAHPRGGAVHVRLSKRDGRTVITDLYMHADEIDSSALRAINTTKIHAMPEAAEGAWIADLPNADASQSRRYPSFEDLQSRAPTPAPGQNTERVRVTRPIGIDPDVFYRRVADAYKHYASTTGRAAASAIAAEAGAPPSAAHRWVREARRRGFLPPGTRGRTG